MQTFYIVLEKNSMSIFEKDNGSFERLYLEGNPEYPYDINSAKECTEKLFSMLVNEYNLDSISEIDLVLINNENTVVSEVMNKVLDNHIKEKIQIEDMIKNISQKLCRDKKLHIEEYVINFDGINYTCNKSGTEKNEFIVNDINFCT